MACGALGRSLEALACEGPPPQEPARVGRRRTHRDHAPAPRRRLLGVAGLRGGPGPLHRAASLLAGRRGARRRHGSLPGPGAPRLDVPRGRVLAPPEILVGCRRMGSRLDHRLGHGVHLLDGEHLGLAHLYQVAGGASRADAEAAHNHRGLPARSAVRLLHRAVKLPRSHLSPALSLGDLDDLCGHPDALGPRGGGGQARRHDVVQGAGSHLRGPPGLALPRRRRHPLRQGW
mmetsp:Transcript_1177/g.2921  ORF Transcript_1177/g.2921 Transcript_1177/m.2921 type:complete len:232 (+) Transcript_1177:426-1121(+)